MKVLFQVTHLLGSGHLSRVLTLARAFVDAGHHAAVLSGGMPVPHLDAQGVEFIQMPPLRSDGVNFGRLLDADGTHATPEYLAARIECARSALETLRPDALITELFPFGRKALAPEFIALLGAAQAMQHRPLILTSIRDILAPPSKPEKAERADRHVAQFYDGVLVHSNVAITPLSMSWPVTQALAEKLHYTGFVAPPLRAHAAQDGAPLPSGEIIVSAGGGSVGDHVFAAAVDAARLSNLPWRILIGGADAATRVAALQHSAPVNVIVEKARADFRQLLHSAACSVSMCGYNTALDILQAGCPAVFVPFDEGSEVEQTLRARSLAERPALSLLMRAELSAEALLAHVKSVCAAPLPAPQTEGFDGASRSVAITAKLVRTLHGAHGSAI